jgi:urease subunit alpha
MFGAFGGALAATCLTFVSKAALNSGALDALGLHRMLAAVRDTRTISKRDLIHNDALPKIDVDSQTYEVRADGVPLTCAPAAILPLAQRYFLF